MQTKVLDRFDEADFKVLGSSLIPEKRHVDMDVLLNVLHATLSCKSRVSNNNSNCLEDNLGTQIGPVFFSDP